MRLEEAERIIRKAKGARFRVYPYSGEPFQDIETCDLFELRHTGIPFGRWTFIVAIDPCTSEIVGQRVFRKMKPHPAGAGSPQV